MNENEERIIRLEENYKTLKESQDKSNESIEGLKEKQVLTEKDVIEMKNDIKYLRGTVDNVNNTLKDLNEKIEKEQLEKIKKSIKKEDKLKDKVVDYVLKAISYLLVGGVIYFIIDVINKFSNK